MSFYYSIVVANVTAIILSFWSDSRVAGVGVVSVSSFTTQTWLITWWLVTKLVAYAITVHRSRELSLPNTLLDIGNSIISCGQVFVALSRITSLQGITWLTLIPVRWKPRIVSLLNITVYRPDLMFMNTKKYWRQIMNDRTWKSLPSVDNVQN